mgnify:CR=1 FL=1
MAQQGARAPVLVRVLVGLLLATVPFAAALVAIDLAPPAQVEIAGQQVSVRPVVGQDTSRLFDGALIRPQHADIAGKPVGLDVDADWNKLVPTDKETRSYLVSLWEDPTPAIHLITDAARRQLVLWGLGGFLAGLLAVGVVVGLWWQRRRRLAGYEPEVAALVARHNRRLRAVLVVGAVAGALVLDAQAVRVWAHDDRQTLVATSSLDGTPLEGTQVTGLLADVLPFLSVLRPRSSFYDTVADNLAVALAQRGAMAPRDGEVVLVAADDFEDVNGMARQVGLTARLLDADAVLLTGDLTFAGKRLETYVLDTVDYYADDRPIHLTPGLHDTRTIVDAARARDWQVADGSVRDIDGLRVLTLPDPRISTVGNLGAGDVLRDPDMDVETFVADAVEQTCAEHPDLVVLHDHLLGRRIAETGCAQVGVLDGRSYDFLGAQQVQTPTGQTTELTLGSAGGHVDTKPDPGIIQHPARFAILYVDPDRDQARYAVVTVDPDASVDITAPVPLGAAGP